MRARSCDLLAEPLGKSALAHPGVARQQHETVTAPLHDLIDNLEQPRALHAAGYERARP